jgi:hypothetical protein
MTLKASLSLYLRVRGIVESQTNHDRIDQRTFPNLPYQKGGNFSGRNNMSRYYLTIFLAITF